MSVLSPAIKAGFLSDASDLSALNFINAAHVQALVNRLRAYRQKRQDGGLEKIYIVIGTGGTLSMKDEGGLRVLDMDLHTVLERLEPGLRARFQLDGLDAFQIDSAQMDYRHVQDLALLLWHIWDECADVVAGFLILHGTDTLSYSGAALSLMMGQGLPFSVVYTAAQKPIQSAMSDATNNIRYALYTLQALQQNDMAEVISVMGERAYLSSAAIKVHDRSMHALDAPLHAPVADFSMLDYPVKLASWLKPRRAHLDFKPRIWQGSYGHSLIIQSHLGLSPDLLARQIEDHRIRAIILYSYGAGTVYGGTIDKVMDAARAKHCPVFVISPVNTHFKIMYESAHALIEQGACALCMTLPAALAKVEIALRLYGGDEIDQLQQFMQQNYVGEVPDYEQT